MTKKVLAVDDNEDILALMSAILGNDQRYHLLLAKNGEEAVLVARREKPDVVFLDVLMPGMDGYEVCGILKGSPDTAHIKVIMLTALTQDFDHQRAIEAGADKYVPKPFSPKAILDNLEQVLGAS